MFRRGSTRERYQPTGVVGTSEHAVVQRRVDQGRPLSFCLFVVNVVRPTNGLDWSVTSYVCMASRDFRCVRFKQILKLASVLCAQHLDYAQAFTPAKPFTGHPVWYVSSLEEGVSAMVRTQKSSVVVLNMLTKLVFVPVVCRHRRAHLAFVVSLPYLPGHTRQILLLVMSVADS